MTPEYLQTEFMHGGDGSTRQENKLPLDACGLLGRSRLFERFFERLFHALAHLAGGRIRKRHDKKFIDIARSAENKREDALDEYGRLAGSRRSCDEDILIARLDGRALCLGPLRHLHTLPSVLVPPSIPSYR